MSLLSGLLLFLSTSIFAQNRVQIIPQPVSVKEQAGEFILNPTTEIVLWGSGLKQEAQYLQNYIQQYFHLQLNIDSSGKSTAKSQIALNYDRLDHPF
ncbi:MAG: hypothetical protein RLZZ543_2154, partial [Bacteroidota bacterium]